MKDKMIEVISDYNRSVISEMSSEAVSGLIQLDASLVEKIVGTDPDPMFVTLEVLNEGVSRNGRLYDASALKEVADQINTQHPDGYAGHISQAERGTKVPDCEVIWLGSRIVESSGKLRLFAKGYVLPEARNRRSYLEKAKALGKNVSVSIYGTAKQIWDKAEKAYRQMNIDLESIDFTRPKSEGVPNSGMFTLTAEMVDDNKVNTMENVMEKAEVLKAATAEEIRENVPEAVIAEITNQAVEQAKTQVISEMSAEKDSVIAEMRAETRGLKLNELLQTKVIDQSARKMIKRMVISEMAYDEEVEVAVDRVLDSEEGKAVVSEMTTIEPTVQPRVEQKAALAAKGSRFIRRKV